MKKKEKNEMRKWENEKNIQNSEEGEHQDYFMISCYVKAHGGSGGQSSTQNNTTGSGSRTVYCPADDLQRQKPPYFPQFRTYEQRKDTYQTERPKCPSRPDNKVEMLIESGFFYTGVKFVNILINNNIEL